MVVVVVVVMRLNLELGGRVDAALEGALRVTHGLNALVV